MVGVRTYSNDDCGDYDPEYITENMICASAAGKDSCWGDSGGEQKNNHTFFVFS